MAQPAGQPKPDRGARDRINGAKRPNEILHITGVVRRPGGESIALSGRLPLPAAATLPGVTPPGVVAHDEFHEATRERGESVFGVATGRKVVPKPQVNLMDQGGGLNLVPLAIAGKERPGGAFEPAVTPGE